MHLQVRGAPLHFHGFMAWIPESQCTYRCVVLPDGGSNPIEADTMIVSMHLQVRGAP